MMTHGKSGRQINNMLTKIIVFIKSLIFHIASGLPKCNQQQIDYRYNICLSCDSYDTKHQECLQCGCNVNNKKIFMNKLAWADQECPLNKWTKENVQYTTQRQRLRFN